MKGWRLVGIALTAWTAGACTPRGANPPPAPDAAPSSTGIAVTPDPGVEGRIARRPFPPIRNGRPLLRGISYGPHREGQQPGGPDPTEAQLREDLHLLVKRWEMIRIYGSRGPAPTILRIIRDDELPVGVVLGAWIAPDDAAENTAEIRAAIDLARAYPKEVIAVSVGNETQVSWSAHRSSRTQLVKYLRAVRRAVAQPVTTADDYNFWNKPESHDVAAEIDFVLMHAYAMWNGKSLEEAVAWTDATVHAIHLEHPALPIVLGETGWATELNPEGNEKEHIHAPAGEKEQATFYEAFTAWTRAENLPYFYFEAFDEPWKGSDDPRDVEKHWGLYGVDRKPKAALEGRE